MNLNRLFLIVLVLALVCPAFFGITIQPAHAVGDNWLTGWSYRKQHIITNSSQAAGTNYQVQIIIANSSSADTNGTNIINENNKARADWADIRFTDSTGNGLLRAWNQTQIDSVNVTCWVKISGTLTNANATIYVYYGKADAVAYWDGTNTFLFFDDFDSWNNTLWTNDTGTGGTISLSGGALVLYAPTTAGAKAKVTGTSSWTYAAFGANISTDVADQSSSYRFWGFSLADESKYIINDLQGGGGFNALTNDGTYTPLGLIDTLVTNQTYLYDTNWQTANATFYLNGTLKRTGTVHVPSTALPIKLANGNSGGTAAATKIYVWWVWARSYVNPEPAHGGIGTEETQPITYSVTFYITFNDASGSSRNFYGYMGYNGTIISNETTLSFSNATTTLHLEAYSPIYETGNKFDAFYINGSRQGYLYSGNPINLLINDNFIILANFTEMLMIVPIQIFNSTSLQVNDTILADASLSTCVLGLQGYYWTWNDGTSVDFTTSPTITHKYATSGLFNVTLEVLDNNDYLASVTFHSVVVSEPPSSFVVWLSTGTLLGAVAVGSILLIKHRS